MDGITLIVQSALTGLLSGFLISIPVGPINLAIVNEGARRGFRWALFIGLGAITMDFLYCAIAFAGFSGLFASRTVRAVCELLSFLAMAVIGMKYLLAKRLPATNPSVQAVEHRLHPHTAFMTGFVRVLGNPAVLLFWATLAATLISHEWIPDTLESKAACVLGMSAGAMLWFILLAFMVSLTHGKVSEKALVRMSHISGACLLAAAAFIAARLVRLIAPH